VLAAGLATVWDANIAKNYNPAHKDDPANLFYILDAGRYAAGRGDYFILEQHGQLVACAGWNAYDLDPSTALVLTRAWTHPRWRSQWVLARFILPLIWPAVQNYDKIWLTCNEHNAAIYRWFEYQHRTGRGAGAPTVYKNFKPIGRHCVYYTDQYVVEFGRDEHE